MLSLFEDAIYIEEIGKGGQGIVDKYQLLNNGNVAIKTFYSDDNEINSEGIKEIHICQILKGCANIIQLLEIKISIQEEVKLQGYDAIL